MVYDKIPSTAIIHTIDVQQFLGFAKQNTTVFRLNVLAMKGDYRIKLRKILKEGNIALTPTLAATIARLTRKFGLSKDSPIK